MKKLVVIITLTIAFGSLKAQSWDEWFHQKKTQKKYLIQQIEALRVYLDYLKKGYNITQKGLNTIENIKNGNFNLHRDFFGSLKKVNPVISNSVKVADIIAFQVYIIRDMKKVYNFCQTSKHFTPEEIRYIGKVHTNMLFLCDANISELLTIINPDKTEMTDDERMMRIDKIYDDMLDKHAFVQSFGNDAQVLSLERTKEEQEIDLLKRNSDIL